MIGWFIVENFIDEKDKAGASVLAGCHLKKEERIKVKIYLPPYIRQNSCEIKAGSEVFAVVDDASGTGCAMYCKDDFRYSIDADLTIQKTLTVDGDTKMNSKLDVEGDTKINSKLDVTNDITSTSGDVVATTISLKNHVHPATLAISGSCSTGPITGTATGNTNAPS